MAGVVNTARLSARLVGKYAPKTVARRGFRVSARERAAQNFTMPALSPTMTEGNIASWRVKEGDTFSAGDVLLEIETDKATMDVEAQDDGIMFKILTPDESKGVKVGQRIGVTADAGDDISSLEIPEEAENKTAGQPARKDRPSPQEETAGGLDKTESSPSASEAPPSSKPNADAEAGGAADTTAAKQKKSHDAQQGGKAQKQTYPLYPAVQHLLHLNGLTKEDADKIPASGPKGRLLKGDVLAYIGKISKDYPSSVSARLTKLSHLDLSNIQLAPPAPKKETPPPAAEAAVPELPQETEIALPISLTAVLETQKRIQQTLNIDLPLSVFIARASDLSNEDLPLSKNRKPTSDELFNSVLGLPIHTAQSARGHYVPLVTAPASTSIFATPSKPARKADIIDFLAPKTAKKSSSRAQGAVLGGGVGPVAGSNVFSVSAKNGEERRAMEYLERLKLVLEKEPGRLVL